MLKGTVKTIERSKGWGFIEDLEGYDYFFNVANVRKELKKRTIFNLLGPLCNPANVNRQCIGVFSLDVLEKYIQVLKNLNTVRAWAFHSYEMTILPICDEKLL